MSDTITLIGVVATTPQIRRTSQGTMMTTFRLASNNRRYDKAQDKWIDGDTNFYGVSTYRELAENVDVSVLKGQHVVVTGRLKIAEWHNTERSGTNVDVDADAVGHDLRWGTTTLTRRTRAVSSASTEAQSAAAGVAPGENESAPGEDELVPGAGEGSAKTLVPAGAVGEETPF
jgi:single-strand DNA-binding protein